MISLPHVAVITRHFSDDEGAPADGGNLNARRLIKLLAERGAKVDVFVRDHNRVHGFSAPSGVDVHVVPVSPSKAPNVMRRAFEEASDFNKELARHSKFWPHRYDAVYTHHWTSAVGLNAVLPPATRLIHVPHLLAVEKLAFMDELNEPNIAAAEREVLARADYIIAVSPTEARAIARLIPHKRHDIIVAPNYVASEFFTTSRSSSKNEGVSLTTIGRVCYQKGTDLLIEAAALLRDRDVQFHLLIVGASYGEDEFESALHRQLRLRSMEQYVTFAGPIPHRDLAQVLARTDIYVQPSRYESQCIAVLEAMASGCLVVTSDLPVMRGYIDPGGNGILTDCQPDALAAAIDFARTIDPARARRMRQGARVFASEFAVMDGSNAVAALCTSPSSDAAAVSEAQCETSLGATLLREAELVAGRLAEIDGVTDVILTGSVARGNADDASDIDLLVVAERRLEHPLLSVWRVDGALMWNVHQVGPDHLKRVASGLGSLHHDGQLHALSVYADELHKARVLRSKNGAAAESILERIGTLRRTEEVSSAISISWLSWSRRLAKEAETAAEDGAREDAQALLRKSALAALTGYKVARGWTQRGAKKRPEIAADFLPDSDISHALECVIDASSLSGIGPTRALRLAELRKDFRQIFVSELSSIVSSLGFDGDSEFGRYRDRIQAHENGGVDYYTPLIRRGFHRGALHHMRVSSGLVYIDAEISALLGYTGAYPRSWMRRESIFAKSVHHTLEQLLGSPDSPANQAKLVKRLR